MGYRRLFIMRKNLGMSSGKLAAQVGHCAEAYWTRLLRRSGKLSNGNYGIVAKIPAGIYEQYVNEAFVKTICEARNKNHLMKAAAVAKDLGLTEGIDFGPIYDKCMTELTPEEKNGATLTRKYHLYK